VAANHPDLRSESREASSDVLPGHELVSGNDEDVDRLEGLDAEEHATGRGDATTWRHDDGSKRRGLAMRVRYMGPHGEQIKDAEDL
jgi:hypothetical protein